MHRFRIVTAAAMLSVLPLAACGDDAEDTATATTTSTTVAEQADETTLAFCQANAELDKLERAPTDEQLQELSDLAPPEMKEDVDLVAERVTAEGPSAFDDPALEEAVFNIDRWRQENCPDPGEG
jgi:hypothetical protein